MTIWEVLALLGACVVAGTAIGWACFVAGHSVGYQERGIDMKVPEATRRRYLDIEPRWRGPNGE